MVELSLADLTSAQREVWQAEQDYWVLTKERDIEGFMALAHDRITVWPHVAPSPVNRANLRDAQRTRCERDPITDYKLSFHAIEVHGDAAIVYYTVATTSNAVPENLKWTPVFGPAA
jgi:hypothetical protein